jgi:hypothetical protein
MGKRGKSDALAIEINRILRMFQPVDHFLDPSAG